MIARVAALVWGPIVIAVLLLPSMMLRERLPEPMATHWGPGDVPDGSMAFGAFLAMSAGSWAVAWLILLGLTLHGRALAYRLGRSCWWGCLSGISTLLIGMTFSTLSANLDTPHWTAARLPGWQIVAVVGVMAAAGGLAGFLGRGPADQLVPDGQAPPRLRLRAGQRTVWISRVVNWWLLLLNGGVLALTVVTSVFSSAGRLPGVLAAGLVTVLVIVMVIGLLSMAVTVRAGDDRLVIGLGPLGRPTRVIPLSTIESAWSETRRPGQVGGWGFRGPRGDSTIMVRGGDCLVIGYRSGGRFAISVDDAARGASLINALIAERVQQ
jgi:hypothetical protein